MNTLPPNLGARLRQIAQSTTQPLPALDAITPDPPELAPGQRLAVQIIDQLADGSYRARSALGNLRLELQQHAEAGAALDLEVTETRIPVVVARIVRSLPDGAAAPAASGARTEFTPTGRMIASLLADPEPAPQPLTVARALGADAPDTAGLASALRGAVESSGLFYEAHQALWVAGKFPLERLRQEPQARYAAPAAPAAGTQAPPAAERTGTPPPEVPAAARASIAPAGLQPFAETTQPGTLPPAASLGLPLPEAAPLTGAGAQITTAEAGATDSPLPQPDAAKLPPGGEQTGSAAEPGQQITARLPGYLPARTAIGADQPDALPRPAALAAGTRDAALPEELRPLVRSQLDALAGSPMAWMGQAWPGAPMKLELWPPEPSPDESSAGNAGAEQSWTTRITLHLPQLGEVQALLVLHADRSLSLRLSGSDAARVEFSAAAPRLAQALSDAALPLAQFDLQAEQSNE
ncbi:MAG: flagellar hook-length control protein FliK [Rhodocyclaceae bacterium]|nr:flagellar hook-length control protein FliK [Rhodocyclaceae bacterium]